MTLTVADLIQPVGYLSRVLFPQDDADAFEDRMDAYLADAVNRVNVAGLTGATADDAGRAWVHYRAYTAVYLDMARTPASLTKNDEGAKSTLASQIAEYKQLAAQAYAEFTALTPTDETTAQAGSRVPFSNSQQATIRW